MLANGVTTLAWNHRTDDGIKAVDGGFVEDALVDHHTHHMSPRPVLLFRADDIINLADDLNQFLGNLGLTETGHELTRHLLRIELLTFTQTSEQLPSLFILTLLFAPALYQFDIRPTLGIGTLSLSNGQNIFNGYGLHLAYCHLHRARTF